MSCDQSHLLLAEELLARRDLASAQQAFDRAQLEGTDPDCCAGGRWMVHMLRGDFASAWRESDAVRARSAPDPNCLWNGQELAGKRVIIRCLHGLGDVVQMVRYAPRLESLCARITWELPPRLLDLAPYFEGVRSFTTWQVERAAECVWDAEVEVMELPYIFRTNLEELPLATNYIQLPPGIIKRVAADMGRARSPRIGVVWAAGDWNRSRSIPLDLLTPILRRKDCEFWNLQGSRPRGKAQQLCTSLHETRACDGGTLALAAVISQLDLVLTVDTLAAHLAGALGVPAWLMLQYAADWRWMVERSDSPWYPSLRLFRQPSAGDWAGVVAQIGEALEEWLACQLQTSAA